MLGQNADEPLDAAENNAVQHNGAVLFAVFAGIGQVKALRHLEVELNGTALPGSAQRIAEVEVDFRSVKRAVALVDFVRLAILFQGMDQGVRRHFPLLVGTHRIFRPGGKLQAVLEPKHLVETVDEVHYAEDFALNLFRRHENVGVVLRKAADAHQTVQRAGKLVAVHQSKLGKALRQVAVRVNLALVNKHAARAVHRLNGIIGAVDFCGVHVVFIMVPVPGTVPQLFTENHRGADFLITVLCMFLAPELLQLVAQNHALRQKEREPRAFLVNVKQVEVAPELAVVALLRFLNHGEVFFQL